MDRRKACLAMAAILLTGCGSVKIARINADPSRYRNHTVRVTGVVVNSMGAFGTGGYEIEDDTGRIYVVSRSGVPSRGTRVTVTGIVFPGAEVFGRPVGIAIRERSHSVH
jgi:hypothetical protein